MSTPLEHYALIGDGETAALVSRDASIDWLCWPRFDSDACFAALLGSADHGRWQIAPTGPVTRHDRRYQPDTLVMETDLHTETGVVRIIDFMPMRDGASSIVRIVVGLAGSVPMVMDLGLRFDYGTVPPWIEGTERGFVARIGPDLVVLYAPTTISLRDDRAVASFTLREGERLAFLLRYDTSGRPTPPSLDADAALFETQHFWRDWIGRFDDRRTRWPEAVRRSLITLKALVHQPTGGLIAAPTTSLPEAPAGKLNWDYRYCWVRDASFAIGALVDAGFKDEAKNWRDWMLRAIGGTPAGMRIMYRVDGSRHITEWEVESLPGWRYARPVRIGNAAASQHQIDVFGELLRALDLSRRGGIAPTEHEIEVSLRIVGHLMEVWDSPGSGIWESRSQPRHYTYSKAMAWVGLNTILNNPTDLGKSLADRLTALCARIREDVRREAWNEGLGSFMQHYGGQELDASLLLLPVIGFLPATDPRMAATIAAIDRDLSEGGLIRRTKASGEGPHEGAFLACSCWMADCLALQGKHDEAAAQLERVLALRNDVGLLSEEYNVPGRHLSGNFPQALSHLAVVNSALRLSALPNNDEQKPTF